jgi:uncharacterized protein YdeI (YjbR/CyaY-like superfamily)
MKPIYFESPAAFRKWLQHNHDKVDELWVGFHKKSSGRPSLTWQQSVDEALCFGWIDGIRKSVDDTRYVIRFTPRREKSIWSAVNIKRVGELTELGLMHAAGKAAFQRRGDDRSAIYSYEQRKTATLPPAFEKQLKANKAAWSFFREQPPSYQRVASFYVISAKRPETQLKRLHNLIAESARGVRIGLLPIPTAKKTAERRPRAGARAARS